MLLQQPPTEFFDTSILGLDLETSSKYGTKISDPHRDDVLLISLSNGRESIVLEPRAWLEQLWRVLHDPDVLMISQKADFDIQFLWSLGFEGYPAKIWDTLIMERVLTAGLGIGCALNEIAWRRANVVVDKSTRKTFAYHRGQFSTQQIEYSRKDADVLVPIYRAQKDKVKADGLEHIAWLENSLVPVTAHMEWVGVGFDLPYWNEIASQEREQASKLEQVVLHNLDMTCYTVDLLTGDRNGINLNSSDQVLAAFNHCGIKVKSTGEKVLKRFMKKHPNHPKCQMLLDFLEYRKRTKRLGFSYSNYVHPVTKRVHTSYNQAGAKTGRFSSRNPNLQNVPREKEYRRMFVAQPEWIMLTADYAQQEMRLLAEMSGDEELKHVCLSEDIHLENTRRMHNDPTISKSDPRRNAAKNAGFAMAYGASAENVAETADIPLEDAHRVVEYTKAAFPRVEEWAREQIRMCNETGYVMTIGGRKRYFHWSDDHNEFLDNQMRNTPIQGSAGDMMKLAMIYVDNALREGWYNARLVLTVHDELVIETPDSEVEDVRQIVLEEMERAGQYYVKSIPTPVDVSVAKWWSK